MPLFPKIASPCPYVSDLAAIMDGDQCRMCKRQVFDLTAMSDDDRLAFLAGCEEEVCVSYSIPIRPALAAAALAAAILPSSAAARPQPAQPIIAPAMIPVAGGLPPPPQVQVVEVPPEATPADVESLYEEGAAKPETAPEPKGDAPPEKPQG